MWLFAPLNTVVLYLSEVETVKEAMFWSVGSLGRTSVDKLKFVHLYLFTVHEFS